MEEDAIKRELTRLENAWMEAVRRRDLPVLECILGEEYTLTTGRPGAEVRRRQEYLDITRNRYSIASFEFEWFEIHIYDEVAVVRSRYRQRGRMDDQDRSTAFLMTDVWVWRDARWQAVARHVSPLQTQ
jgi:hypothetical protein